MVTDNVEVVNVDQAINLVEQVANFLLAESDGTHILTLALLHEAIAVQLKVSPAAVSKQAGVLMSNVEFRAHLRKVAEQRMRDREAKAPGHLEIVK